MTDVPVSSRMPAAALTPFSRHPLLPRCSHAVAAVFPFWFPWVLSRVFHSFQWVQVLPSSLLLSIFILVSRCYKWDYFLVWQPIIGIQKLNSFLYIDLYPATLLYLLSLIVFGNKIFLITHSKCDHHIPITWKVFLKKKSRVGYL